MLAQQSLGLVVLVFVRDAPPGYAEWGRRPASLSESVRGLAEVLRRPGLAEQMQREFRVVAAGPTTLAALLNSLQLGFRTLAIEKRSSEVWALLGAVKTEFGRFGDLLDKTHQKLKEAGATIEDAAKKSRTIERRLKKVQELPQSAMPPLNSDDDTGEPNPD